MRKTNKWKMTVLLAAAVSAGNAFGYTFDVGGKGLDVHGFASQGYLKTPEGPSREFTLRFSGSEKPDLVFDCQGQGWFDADCDIIVTKES